MAKDTKKIKGHILSTVDGIAESVPLTVAEPSVVSNSGSYPFFYGMYQRIFGKKIIDFNPDQAVYAIHQTFNGICLYGYYVQTSKKLYYHLCDAPPDLRIRFFVP